MDSFYSLKFILMKRKIKEQWKTIQMKMAYTSVGHVNTEYFPSAKVLSVCRNAKQRKRQRTVICLSFVIVGERKGAQKGNT